MSAKLVLQHHQCSMHPMQKRPERVMNGSECSRSTGLASTSAQLSQAVIFQSFATEGDVPERGAGILRVSQGKFFFFGSVAARGTTDASTRGEGGSAHWAVAEEDAV